MSCVYRNRYRGRNRYRNRLWHTFKTDCDCDCDCDPDTDSDADHMCFIVPFSEQDRSHIMIPGQDPSGRPETFTVEIEKVVYGGEGLGRYEGKVVFVPFTAPGDLVEVKPVERKKGYIRAVVARILRPGPGRQDPPCPHFGSCGGCQWQHLEYALQVETKRRILEEAFHHRLPASRELPIVMHPCPQPFAYRSRARLQLRGTESGSVVGFFRHRSHAVEDVSACPLFRPALNEALTGVRTAQRKGDYGSGAKEVELASADDGSWACTETVTEPDPAENTGKILSKSVGDFVYAVAASVFFQANDFMLTELLKAVMELAAGRASALDLYSGVGFFTLPLARRFREVVAVESDRNAHQLCNRNAANAGFDNIRTACADVEKWMQATASIAAPAYDLILLDPPRSGAGPGVMSFLKEWAPQTIIYVSCDPQTLTRDLAMLPAFDYGMDAIAGFDLFPQTYHFETVVRLHRR